MHLPRLVRRRELPVPTPAGALALSAMLAVVAIVLVRTLFAFLAPVAPIGGGLLVVEGWAGAPAFDEALRRFQSGRYERIVVTGGPIELDSPIAAARSWAEFGAQHLAARGIAPGDVAVIASPASAQDRTFLSAVTLRDWLAAQHIPVTRLDIVTLGPHGRRSRRLYQLAFGSGVAIGIVSATPTDYDPQHWWASSEGAKSVLGEAIGWGWSVCCFAPGDRGSEAEKWGPSR